MGSRRQDRDRAGAGGHRSAWSHGAATHRICGTADRHGSTGLHLADGIRDGGRSIWGDLHRSRTARRRDTAPLPHGRRVLAFHTDADLLSAADVRNTTALLARARRQPQFAAALKHARFTDRSPFVCAAHGCRLEPTTGDGWFAAGDASMAFDPLSSQGLLNALYTGSRFPRLSIVGCPANAASSPPTRPSLPTFGTTTHAISPPGTPKSSAGRTRDFWQRHGGAIRSASSL